MRKRYLIAILASISLIISVSSSYAKPPDWNGGLVIYPPFWQWEDPWADDYYAGKSTKPFKKHGCLVTSIAMLYIAHGFYWIPDNNHDPDSTKRMNPRNLNNWLTENKIYTEHTNNTGYVEDNLYPPNALMKFVYKDRPIINWYEYIYPTFDCQPVSNAQTCYQVDWSENAETLLNDDILWGSPDIMKISWTDKDGNDHPSHFVVAAGYEQKSSSYIAYDPNQDYNKVPPDGLKKLYSAPMGYTPLRIDRYAGFYKRGQPNISTIVFNVHSPVEIQVFDPKGIVTGYDPDTGAKTINISRSSYSEDSEPSVNTSQAEPVKTLAIDQPPSGNYILKIFGTGDGPYTIKMQGTREDGTVNLDTSITGTATPSLYETYRVTYSPTGEATLSSTNQLPVANAGNNQTGEQGYEIQLDGSRSYDLDGDPLKYTWNIVSRPSGSNIALSNANIANPTFTPDLAGEYVVQLVLNDYFTDSSPSTVTITATPIKSRISVTPNFSTPLSAGSTFINFDVNNTGRIDVSNGMIDITLNDPDGLAIFNGSQNFSIVVGETKTVSIPITIPSLKFGNYILTYTQSDETKTGSPTMVSITNSAIIEFSFDKISYKARETANLTVDLINTGKFNLYNVSLIVTMPDANYTETKTVFLPLSTAHRQLTTFIIPDAISAGQHDVNITLSLQLGSSIVQSAKLTIPESSLTIGYTGQTNITVGDVINLTIENTGGVDTTYTTEKLTITDNRGAEIQLGVLTGAVMVSERKSIADVLVPGQMAAGLSSLAITLKDIKTGKLTNLVSPLFITGLEASIAARTDKDVYLNTEGITGFTSLTNGAFGIENGSMDVKVVKYKGATVGEFTHFLPKTGWGPIKNPGYVAVAPDGSVYVIDYSVKGCGFMCDIYDYYILKFSSSGAFIAKWGSFGSNDGQFDNPQAIAVGSDGSVYVVDSGNNRIQVFDSNGNFITKWGIQGSGDGQFDYPMSIAVVPDGSVYVGDYWGERIQRFDSNGNFITKWGSYGSGDGQFKSLRGIAVSLDGSVYVADSGNFRIQKFDSNGNFITKWGSYGSGDGQFGSWPTNITLSPDGSVYIISVYSTRVQKFDSNGNFIMGRWESFYPKGIAVAPDSNVYVTDSSQVMKFDANWQLISTWGSYGSSDSQFYAPSDVTIGSDDTIYIVDSYNNRIQRFDKNGNFVNKWGVSGSGNGQFYYPYGIAATHDGFVYVVERSGSRVQKFDSNGNFIAKWGSYGNGDGQFSYPYGIAVVPDGSVYVADTYNNRVQKFDSNGNFITKWGSYGSGDGQFSYPYGIAVVPDGFVYVADTYNNRIQKFDSTGNFIAKWGSTGNGDGQFSSLQDIVVDTKGFVYTSEYGNSRIQKFDSNGNFITKWNVVDKDGQAYLPYGIAVGADGSIYAVNTENNRILRMVPSTGIEIFFETILPIIQSANITQGYTTNIGTLNTTGKLYLEAILKNSLSQTIATAEYPFYIVEGDTVLLLNIDKKVYRQGEMVMITGEVRNLATISLDNAVLLLNTATSALINQTITVPAGGSYPFTFTTSADAEGTIILTGTVTQNNSILAEITDQYEVAAPSATITAAAPDVVGRSPFDLIVEVKNTGKVEASMQYTVSAIQGTIDSQSLIISAGETKSLQYSQQITAATTYMVTLYGDVIQSATKTVIFGEAAEIQLGAGGSELEVRQEGRIEIPVTITNTGLVDESLTIDFSLQPLALTESRNYFLPKGGSISDSLYYNLSQGDYQVSAVSALPNASDQTALKMIRENDVAMTTSVSGQDANGLIPVIMNLVNNGYNTLNGNIALAVINNEGKAIWRGEVLVSNLASQASQNYIINIDSADVISGAYPTKSLLYSTSGHELAANEVQIRVLGPIFEIMAMPNYPTFTVGKQGSFTFAIKNTGTVTGTMSFSIKAMDVLNQSVTDTFNPGEEKTFAFSFTVPEDAEEKDYLADYVLMPVSSQGMSGQVKFHITGVNIGATASLDKDVYRNGDTAGLTLNISKLSQFEDGDYLAIIRYGAHHDMQSFALNSQQVTFTFSVPLTEITGENLFYSIHFVSGKTIYRDSLAINEAQPELFIETLSASQMSLTTYQLDAIITNQGKIESGATVVVFYDGDPNIIGNSELGTASIPSLAPGNSIQVSLNWNVLGKAGSHTIYAVVDPNNTVTEWIETNNTKSIDITLPNVTLGVSTTNSSYMANQDVGILFNIANLTSGITYQGLKLDTMIVSTQGITVFNTINDAPALPPAAETAYALNWNIQSNIPGDYTIQARLMETANTLTEGSAIFTILPTPSIIGSLSINKDTVIQRFSLDINYTLINNGNIDISSGEAKVELIPSGSQTALAAYTQSFGQLTVLANLSQILNIQKIEVETGDYIVRLTAIAEGVSFIIGEKQLKVLPPIEVTKGISLLPRVLALFDEKAEGIGQRAEGQEEDLNQTIITNALDSLGAYYQIVTNKEEFRQQMRSGIYNTYILIDKQPVEDHLDEELTERINSGERLILMNYEKTEDEKFRELVGAKSEGHLSDKDRTLTIIQNPMTAQGVLSIIGKVEKLEMTISPNVIIAATIEEKGKTYPGIFINPYGHGKVITFTFDMGESAEAFSSTALYTQLLTDAVTYVAPEEIKPISGTPFGIEINTKSLGAEFDLKVIEKVDTTLSILLTYPGSIDKQEITWEFKLQANDTERHLYLIKLPEDGGTYTPTTEISYLKNGSYEPYNIYPISIITEGLAELEMRILFELQAITDKKAQDITEDYQKLINKITPNMDKKDTEKLIYDMLEIIKELKELKSDTATIRFDMDVFLKILERRWVEAGGKAED